MLVGIFRLDMYMFTGRDELQDVRGTGEAAPMDLSCWIE